MIGATLDPAVSGSEIDVLESFFPGEVHRHNVFTGGYGQDMKRAIANTKIGCVDPSEFHRFGLLWDETGYTFYIDGEEDGHVEGPVSHCAEFILVGTEVMGYRKADHAPTDEARAAVGDTFIVDYVRVFDAVKE